jgi:formylglycine-generating enzyme required for sulfatase activity
MPEQTDTGSRESLQRRLAVYRRTVELLEIQRAQFGAFTPPYIWHQFDEARSAIARIKQELRALGVPVDDVAIDTGGPPTPLPATPALLPTYLRMVIDQASLVPLTGLTEWVDLGLRLADVYCDRQAVPLRPGTGAPGVALASLLRERGARVLLEGPLGAGKTFALRALALACAGRARAEPSGLDTLLDSWKDAPIPVLLSAAEIAAALRRADAEPHNEHQPALSTFWRAIEGWLRYSDLSGLVPAFQEAFESGGCLLMIDGFDDLPAGADQHAFTLALSRLVARYPHNRVVVTCRSADPAAFAPILGFARYTLGPLGDDEAKQMIARWYDALAGPAGALPPDDLPERRARLEGALAGDERLRALADRPLTLTLCVLAHAEGRELPAGRDFVLRRFCNVLLAGWYQQQLAEPHGRAHARDLAPLASIGQRQALLEPLAYAFQAQVAAGRQPAALGHADVTRLLGEVLRGSGIEPGYANEVLVPSLLRWCCRQGILARSGSQGYTMPWSLIREYLAGLALAAAPDFLAAAQEVRALPAWRGPLLQAIRELDDRAQIDAACAFLEQLRPSPGQPADPADLLLAAEGLLELHELSNAAQAIRAEVRALLAAWRRGPRTPVTDRIRAGSLLGRLETTRAPLLPELARVPAGPCVIGYDDGYDDERPAQFVNIPAFSIGIYPITNREYALFLEEQGDARHRPKYWYDPRFNNPYHPVVGVTWHDAVAYCGWLTARLRADGLLPPGAVVRLPLEVEWEKAASWDDAARRQRRFPWGDTWSPDRANTLDGRGDWLTAPVGSYPDGISPYGLHDCTGNVWEWTASIYASYPGAPSRFREEGRYAIRGSSCASLPTNARCSYRSRLSATSWRYHLGFRIVIAVPLEDLDRALASVQVQIPD